MRLSHSVNASGRSLMMSVLVRSSTSALPRFDSTRLSFRSFATSPARA